MTYKLIHGDCLEEMAKLEPASVDLILTDPPYGTTACSWDTIIPFDPMWEAIKRVRKPRAAVVLFGSEPFSSMLRVSNLKEYKYDWVWEKNIHSNFLNGQIEPLKQHENIVVFCDASINIYNPQRKQRVDKSRVLYGYKDNGHRNGYGRFADGTRFIDDKETRLPSSVIKYDVERGLHPTQKPVTILEYLIKTYTNPGAVVLDFTMGSGSTGVAAVKLGRDFIGIDNGYCEKEGSEWYGRPWVDVARHRIANAAGDFMMSETERKTGQLALFEAIQ